MTDYVRLEDFLDSGCRIAEGTNAMAQQIDIFRYIELFIDSVCQSYSDRRQVYQALHKIESKIMIKNSSSKARSNKFRES